MQRRGAVEEHRVAFEDIFEDFPDDGILAIHQFLGRFYGFHNAALDELPNNEWLEQFSRHRFGNAALMELQGRAYHDHRTTGVVHTLTQQVLTETALLAFKNIAQRLERPTALSLHGIGFAGVVEQRVHGFLQHPLFVAQDHFRSFDFQKALEAVVADDNPAIEVVEVGTGKAAAIQRHQGAQFGRHYRQVLDDHPFRAILHLLLTFPESLHHAQTLECFRFALLRSLIGCLIAQIIRKLIQIKAHEHIANGLGAHAGNEFIRVAVV